MSLKSHPVTSAIFGLSLTVSFPAFQWSSRDVGQELCTGWCLWHGSEQPTKVLESLLLVLCASFCLVVLLPPCFGSCVRGRKGFPCRALSCAWVTTVVWKTDLSLERSLTGCNTSLGALQVGQSCLFALFLVFSLTAVCSHTLLSPFLPL